MTLLCGFASGILALSGCGGESVYTAKPLLLPTHIRSIAVRPFINNTNIPGLERKLLLRVTEEFMREGRLPVVSNENDASGIIAGDIARYIREPLSYDANHVVEEYKLWVVIDFKFIDRVNRTQLWEEPRLEQSYRYFVETRPGGRTEEEAREELWRLFASDIVKRTIEGFGSVSGASERKVISHPIIEGSTTPRGGGHGPH